MIHQQTGADRIPVLDGLRGFAAVMVIASHCANVGLLPRVLGHGAGQMAVMLFFALSGYLMGHLYLERSFGTQGLATYLRHRAARVLPLYFVAVTIAWLHPPFIWTFSVPGRELEHFLVLRGAETLWTIPVEVHFYVIFIATWWAAARRRFWPTWTVAALGMVVLAVGLFFSGVAWTILPFWAHYFLFGVATAWLWAHRPAWRLESSRAALGWIACFAMLAALPEWRRMAGLWVPPNWADPLASGAAMLFFIAALLPGGPMRLLGTRIPRFYGTISYSLYVIHYPVLMTVRRHVAPETPLAGLAVALAVLGITTALAWPSYRYIELPAQDWIRGRRRLRLA